MFTQAKIMLASALVLASASLAFSANAKTYTRVTPYGEVVTTPPVGIPFDRQNQNRDSEGGGSY